MSNVIESFDSDFESIVILNDDKQRDMLRCKLCGNSTIRNVEGSKHQHRFGYCRGIAFETFHFKLKPKNDNEGNSGITCLICSKKYRSISASFAIVHRRYCGGFQCVNLNLLPKFASGFESARNIIPRALNSNRSDNANYSIESGKSFSEANSNSQQENISTNVDAFQTRPYADLRDNFTSVVPTTNSGDNSTRIGQIINELQYKEVYIRKSNRLKKAAQCQRCGKIIRTRTTIRLTMHRRICLIREKNHAIQSNSGKEEVLISVSTEPFEDNMEHNMEDNMEESDDDNLDIDIDDVATDENSSLSPQQIETSKTCFICDKTSNESLINLYTGQTKHSSTPIYDIVWKFMDNEPSERIQINDLTNSDLPGVCIECFDQLNEYDLAIVSSEKLEEQIRAKLSHTENRFLQNKNGATEQENEQSEKENNSEAEPVSPNVETIETNQEDFQNIESNESNQVETIDLSIDDEDDDDVIEIRTET